jgi:predicted dehydrogenase
MAAKTIGIIVNGATGGIANRQHLDQALVPLIREGGLETGTGRIVPELLLVGRDAGRLEAVARRFGLARWTTDLDGALADPDYPVFFDAGVTGARPGLLAAAIGAGKHVYAEKPVVTDLREGRRLVALAEARGVRHGVVEDKLFLPGLAKLRLARDGGFFGRVVGFRLDFGYWIFSGDDQPMQRPSSRGCSARSPGWCPAAGPRCPSGWTRRGGGSRWMWTIRTSPWSSWRAARSG